MFGYLDHVFKAVFEIIYYFFTVVVFQKPISYPGDPIRNQQSRKGTWFSRDTFLNEGWLFAHDKESHEVSEKMYPGCKLTGKSEGRQIWYRDEEKDSLVEKTEREKMSEEKQVFRFCPAENPNSADKPFREFMISKWKGKTPDTSSKPTSAREAAEKALEFYQMLQCEDGHWAGDYGGPMFLMPGLICALYISKTPYPPGRKAAMISYLRNHQQVDGGWGTHIECASTMFGTVLSYLALRLLGEEKDEPYLIESRRFIIEQGGALYAPSWAKFWLALMGLYDWRGINSIPAEMFLLPRWFPLHPGKLWCHCRMVYLPMCYLYCSRFTADVETDPLLQSLREELYCENYNTINWDHYRQTCAPDDQYSPLNSVMKIVQDFLAWYEVLLPKVPLLANLRVKGLKFVMEYIHAEDSQTNYIDIGPVNKALNMVCVWSETRSSASDAFQKHIARVDDYLWVAEDGMKMQGYNGSQTWDTSFCAQAIAEGNMAPKFVQCARKVYSFLDATQIEGNEADRDYYYRHISKGGWPFSTAAHGWPISDCTAEGLKCVLSLHGCDKETSGLDIKERVIPLEMRISEKRLEDACDVLLSFHNADGGWATYENMRGSRWYEYLNPSETFGDIMIDYSYVECSSACMTALVAFNAVRPQYRRGEILNAIETGKRFLKSIQREDGSWYGSWGCCFTYGTWFGIEGLVAAGEDIDSPAIKRACHFLLSKQNPNGGWGENYLACVNKKYSEDGAGRQFIEPDGDSGVVQTAWALLGLMAAGSNDKAAIDRGKGFLMRKQLPSGDWDQECITGVFNRSCGITYTAYRNVFPMWALARYGRKYEL